MHSYFFQKKAFTLPLDLSELNIYRQICIFNFLRDSKHIGNVAFYLYLSYISCPLHILILYCFIHINFLWGFYLSIHIKNNH